jgi:regulatory protein
MAERVMDDSAADRVTLDRALGLAYRALGRRERSVSEMRELLGRRRVDEETIEEAVEALTRDGVLDDAGFARRYASDKRDLDQWGSERIAGELRRRGVGPADVEAAIAERGRQDELDTALLLLGRRVPRPPRDDRERDRAWRLLVRRGYEPELAYEALREHERRVA